MPSGYACHTIQAMTPRKPTEPLSLIALRLPPALLAKIDARADREERSRSDVIREALEAHLGGIAAEIRSMRREIEALRGDLGRRSR